MYPVTVRNRTVPFRNLMEEFFGESTWPEVFGETGKRRFSPVLDLQAAAPRNAIAAGAAAAHLLCQRSRRAAALHCCTRASRPTRGVRIRKTCGSGEFW